eukprot:sb/3470947/
MLVHDPERFIDQFKEAGCDCFLFQLETVTDDQAKSLIGKIKEAGMKAGVALSQECEVSRLEGLIKDVDLVHISCGDPCHDDVPFNPEMLEKVAAARKMHKKILIEIEGNVTSDDVWVQSRREQTSLSAGTRERNQTRSSWQCVKSSTRFEWDFRDAVTERRCMRKTRSIKSLWGNISKVFAVLEIYALNGPVPK